MVNVLIRESSIDTKRLMMYERKLKEKCKKRNEKMADNSAMDKSS